MIKITVVSHLRSFQLGFRCICPFHTSVERYQSGNKRYHSIETVSLLVTAQLNLSKAFASICPSILLNKLQALRTSANALNWFQSYLTGREQITDVGISISLLLIVFFFNFYLNFKVKYSLFLIKHKYLQNSISATYNTQNAKHYLRMFVPTREPCIKTLEVLMVRREEGR